MQRNTQTERNIEDLQFELDFPENVEIIQEIEVKQNYFNINRT